MNWRRNTAIQLDFFDAIRDNVVKTGANGAVTPPPPNHDGGVGSTMISTSIPPATEPKRRPTYRQDWPAYNAAQTNEHEQFVVLLRDLCDGIPQPPQTFGRPRLALSDVVFGITLKAYTTMSGRRAMSSFRDAERKGLLGKAPSFTSTFRYLENPELTPLFKSLIQQTAAPLSAVEHDFAADSTGFATSTYARWFDHKWGKERLRQTWVKTHVMVEITTHTVTAVEATATVSADARQFPKLLADTAQNLPTINEASADKAYSSRRNLRAVDAVGATTYIPFRHNSKGHSPHHKFDGLWNRAWHFYNFNREQFLAHYHKRSNAESAIAMIKAKFGGSVRSKTSVAQVSEVLAKILCHNVCVLIQSIHELGLEPLLGLETFGTRRTSVPYLRLV